MSFRIILTFIAAFATIPFLSPQTWQFSLIRKDSGFSFNGNQAIDQFYTILGQLSKVEVALAAPNEQQPLTDDIINELSILKKKLELAWNVYK